MCPACLIQEANDMNTLTLYEQMMRICICEILNFSIMMSYLAISLGDWLCINRNMGQGEVGTPKGCKQHGCVWP